MAAISGWRHDPHWKKSEMTTGFVIVTDQSAGGMVDVHDRWPVVLTALFILSAMAIQCQSDTVVSWRIAQSVY